MTNTHAFKNAFKSTLIAQTRFAGGENLPPPSSQRGLI
jgi:hypothetical protein